MDTDRMYRVLATHWEAEEYTEYWCRGPEEADLIARLLRAHDNSATVQVDRPRKKEAPLE